MTSAQELLARYGIPYFATRKGKFTTTCPSCGGGYLNVEEKRDGIVWFCHACHKGGGDKFDRDHLPTGNGKDLCAPTALYEYNDETGKRLFQVLKFEPLNAPKQFRQRTAPDQTKWSIKDVRIVPYRLPEMIEAIAAGHVLFVVEGEKDVETLRKHGVPATTNPMGAGKWRPSFNELFKDGDIVICGDNDDPGRDHVKLVAENLRGSAKRVRVLDLKKFWPEIEQSDDISDWFGRGGGTVERLWELVERCNDDGRDGNGVGGATEQAAIDLGDFVAYSPTHSYIFKPTREMWAGASVNARLPEVKLSNGKTISPAAWLDKNRSVDQMTWSPGEPMLIEGRLVADGGWIERKGSTCFNLYRPPIIERGDASKAAPWLDHVRKMIYPEDADHILRWLAHRVQRPQEKINHALLLGGAQGIGKDTLLEPIKHAVGPWNFHEVSPQHMLGRFNGFLRSVVLRVNEVRDLGDVDRYGFYDHMKAYTAAPPDVLRCDEKNLREYSILNVCGVIITSNHKTDGLFLPADDRRHYVAWSDLTKNDFHSAYWTELWGWYQSGGFRHVAAYLAELDLSGFDPKAPPKKTGAFWSIVDASRSPEESELADVLDAMGRPTTITLDEVRANATGEFSDWLQDRKNRRIIPHRMEDAGYVPVRNDTAEDGLWKTRGKRQVIYAKAELSLHDRFAAVGRRSGGGQ